MDKLEINLNTKLIVHQTYKFEINKIISNT